MTLIYKISLKELLEAHREGDLTNTEFMQEMTRRGHKWDLAWGMAMGNRIQFPLELESRSPGR